MVFLAALNGTVAMRPTEQMIWLIESRMRENPRLDDIVAEIGLSRFYVSRLFAEEMGITFSAYVRGRRLSEAAKELLGGASDILGVAIGAGYGSHEAFTRAFREQFGIPPEVLRDRGRTNPIRLVEPLRMNAKPNVPLDAATIESLPAARYVGLARTYEITNLGAIPDQWVEFQQHLEHMDRAGVGAAYGIVRNAAHNGETLEYIAAVPVGHGLEAGNGLVEVSLPQMTVAKFAHRGHISGIKEATQAVFEEGLPAVGLRSQGPVDLIEVYGPDFDPRSGYGTVGLWVQVA